VTTTKPFFFDYPAAERLAAKRRRAMQRAVAIAGEQTRRAVQDCTAMKIMAYRDTLPPHRQHWFDLLSYADQRRLALYREDTRDDTQRDYDEERDHGWSV
jgi:hypothetical protein